MEKGYVQIYTGNGKGKTTAALGLALRAICAGKKVFIGQFTKGMKYSELKAAEFLPGLTIEQFGRDRFIFNNPEEEDIKYAKAGLERIKEVTTSGQYDVIIMDEINIAIMYNLVSVEEVLELVNNRVETVEIVMTGRHAPQKLIDAADLVTEMKEIKHYYKKGVNARVGIEK